MWAPQCQIKYSSIVLTMWLYNKLLWLKWGMRIMYHFEMGRMLCLHSRRRWYSLQNIAILHRMQYLYSSWSNNLQWSMNHWKVINYMMPFHIDFKVLEGHHHWKFIDYMMSSHIDVKVLEGLVKKRYWKELTTISCLITFFSNGNWILCMVFNYWEDSLYILIKEQ